MDCNKPCDKTEKHSKKMERNVNFTYESGVISEEVMLDPRKAMRRSRGKDTRTEGIVSRKKLWLNQGMLV